MVYVWSQPGEDQGEQASLGAQIGDMQTQFKSEDGKFKLHLRRKSDKKRLASVVIKDPKLCIKIQPQLT